MYGEILEQNYQVSKEGKERDEEGNTGREK